MIKSKYFVLVLVLIVLLGSVLFLVVQNTVFQKHNNMKLSIPNQTVPLIEMRTSESDQSFVQLHLCVWDPASAVWFRDDVPICEIQGGPVKVFWNGTRRVFLSPSNPRGSFRIIKQNPLFQIISLPLSDLFVPIKVADTSDLSYYCVLEQHQQGKDLRVSFFNSKNPPQLLKSVPIEPIESSIILEAVAHELSHEQAKFFFSFNKQKDYGSSHGLMKCSIPTQSPSEAVLETAYESFYAESGIYYQKTASDLYRIGSNREIGIMQSEILGFLPFTLHRSILRSFYDYLFKQNHPQGIKTELGIELKEFSTKDLRISQYDQIMLVLWKPGNIVLSSASKDIREGSALPIAQFSAIMNSSVLGYVQRTGKLLRFFSENRLQQELVFPEDGFFYEYISP